MIDDAGRDALREALPPAGVKLFEHLGHNPFWENPQGVAAVIHGLLEGGRCIWVGYRPWCRSYANCLSLASGPKAVTRTNDTATQATKMAIVCA
jgi:hypothetical protein